MPGTWVQLGLTESNWFKQTHSDERHLVCSVAGRILVQIQEIKSPNSNSFYPFKTD